MRTQQELIQTVMLASMKPVIIESDNRVYSPPNSISKLCRFKTFEILKIVLKENGRYFYFLVILLLINTIDSNEAMTIGRITHDGNSGTVGVGVGFWEE